MLKTKWLLSAENSQLERMPSVAAAILGNAYTRAVFRVGSGDAKKLAEGFSFFEWDDIESLGRGQAIVRIGGAANDCNMATIPVRPIPREEAEARTAAAILHSRTQYAIPLAELKEQFSNMVSAAGRTSGTTGFTAHQGKAAAGNTASARR